MIYIYIYIRDITFFGRLWNDIHETHKITTIHKQTLHQNFCISHFICISSFCGCESFLQLHNLSNFCGWNTHKSSLPSHMSRQKCKGLISPKVDWIPHDRLVETTEFMESFPWMSRDWLIIRGGIKRHVLNKMYSFDKIEGHCQKPSQKLLLLRVALMSWQQPSRFLFINISTQTFKEKGTLTRMSIFQSWKLTVCCTPLIKSTY